VREVGADGNCMFRAIAYLKNGSEDGHDKVRKRCIKYIRDHPEKYLDYQKGENQLQELEKHCEYMSQAKKWGSDLELSALADCLKCTILLHVEGTKVE